MHKLNALGWMPQLYPHDLKLDEPDTTLARVALEDREGYLLLTEAGPTRGLLVGALRLMPEDAPVVGDWVRARLTGPGQPAIIDAVLPRRTHLTRRAAGTSHSAQHLAANMDAVFVVTSPNLDFNPRRLERYLAMALAGGVTPVIVLNKADLVPDPAPWLERCDALAPGVSVVALSALRQEGLEALDPWLGPGRTVALLGSSGVGKSTLTNALLGQEQQRTFAIRDDDHEGRHTTTGRHLFVLPQQRGLLLDTPGLREIQSWLDTEAVDQVFQDITEYAHRCRFRDCTHNGEPGCAVQEAIEQGELRGGRLRSYQKLRREAAHHEQKTQQSQKLQRAQTRKKQKTFSKMARRVMRDKYQDPF